jgi:hypothetical protein
LGTTTTSTTSQKTTSELDLTTYQLVNDTAFFELSGPSPSAHEKHLKD